MELEAVRGIVNADLKAAKRASPSVSHAWAVEPPPAACFVKDVVAREEPECVCVVQVSDPTDCFRTLKRLVADVAHRGSWGVVDAVGEFGRVKGFQDVGEGAVGAVGYDVRGVREAGPLALMRDVADLLDDTADKACRLELDMQSIGCARSMTEPRLDQGEECEES